MRKIQKNNRFMYLLIIAVLFSYVCKIMTVEAADDGQQSGEQPIMDGIYKMVSAIDNNFVWDIENASTEDGGNLQLFVDNNANAQKFIFTYDSDGFYIITNVNSEKAMEGVQNAEGAANIQQSTANGSDTQKWKLVPAENGYYVLICKYNGLAADASGGVAANGVNMQMYQLNNTPAQEFKLVETTKAENQPVEIHSKSFFSNITFLLLGAEAIILVVVNYYFQIIVNRKREFAAENEDDEAEVEEKEAVREKFNEMVREEIAEDEEVDHEIADGDEILTDERLDNK